MRLAAVELAMIELVAWIDQAAVDDSDRSIRADLQCCSADESAIRLQALSLLEDGQKRFVGQGKVSL